MDSFNISKMENSNLVIEHIYNVDNYIVINTNLGSYLLDNEELYFLGQYKNVEKVLKINDEIYIVVNQINGSMLVNLLSMEILLKSPSNIGMNFLNNRYVSVHSYVEDTKLYDLKTKTLIKEVKKLKFEFILKDDVFVYENDEYERDKHKRYIINNKGEIIYDCGISFPYLVNGNLFLVNVVDEEINIIHNFFGNKDKSTIIKKQGIVLGKPQYYKGDIVIVTYDNILILDADLNIKKTISYETQYPINDTTIERNAFLMKIKVGEKYRTVCVGLDSDYILEYDSIELLPYWLDRKRHILAFNKIDDKLKEYYLFDEEGKILYKNKSRDAHIIENNNYDLFIFYYVNSEEKSVVYNTKTHEEMSIPYLDVDFKTTSNGEYQEFALCFNEKSNLYDIVDNYLNVVFSNINLNNLKISENISSVRCFVNNNYVLIIERISDGPRNYWRKCLFDKDNNVIYNGFNANITPIGKYFEILYENEKISYLNTETGIITNTKDSEKEALPNNLTVEDNKIVLKKNRV